MPQHASEEAFHRAVAQTLSLVLLPGSLATTIPSGGGGRIRGARLKAMGLLPGLPDWLIAHGGKTLWIELKTAAGRVSPEQKLCHDRLRLTGHAVEVCRSIDQVVNALDRHNIPHRLVLPTGAVFKNGMAEPTTSAAMVVAA